LNEPKEQLKKGEDANRGKQVPEDLNCGSDKKFPLKKCEEEKPATSGGTITFKSVEVITSYRKRRRRRGKSETRPRPSRGEAEKTQPRKLANQESLKQASNLHPPENGRGERSLNIGKKRKVKKFP